MTGRVAEHQHASSAVSRIKRPPVIIQYGPRKSGKTVATTYGLPLAVHISDKGSLIPAITVVGYAPRFLYARTMTEALEKAESAMGKKRKKGPPLFGLVFDEWSLSGFREKRDAGYGDWDTWRGFNATVLDTLEKARQIGDIHDQPVVFGCHPFIVDGNIPPGGPEMPTGPLSGKVPGFVDGIYFIRTPDEDSRVVYPERGRYTTEGEGKWMAGDRLNIVGRSCPMNIGEILRAYYGGSKDIPRAPGFEWLEESIEKAAQYILDDPKRKHKVFQVLADKVNSRVSEGPFQAKWRQEGIENWDVCMITWALRDLRHRVEIRKHSRHSRLVTFGVKIKQRGA